MKNDIFPFVQTIRNSLNRIRCLCDINRNNLEEMINLDIHACMKTSYETQV